MAINIIDINVKSLIPNPNNPRKDVGDVTELADSIKEQGLQQALVVTGRGYSGGSTYGDPAKPANQQQGWQNGSPAQNPGMPEGDPWAQPAPASPGATFGASNDFSSDSQDPEF